jgi:hypothetical protein
MYIKRNNFILIIIYSFLFIIIIKENINCSNLEKENSSLIKSLKKYKTTVYKIAASVIVGLFYTKQINYSMKHFSIGSISALTCFYSVSTFNYFLEKQSLDSKKESLIESSIEEIKLEIINPEIIESEIKNIDFEIKKIENKVKPNIKIKKENTNEEINYFISELLEPVKFNYDKYSKIIDQKLEFINKKSEVINNQGSETTNLEIKSNRIYKNDNFPEYSFEINSNYTEEQYLEIKDTADNLFLMQKYSSDFLPNFYKDTLLKGIFNSLNIYRDEKNYIIVLNCLNSFAEKKAEFMIFCKFLNDYEEFKTRCNSSSKFSKSKKYTLLSEDQKTIKNLDRYCT